MHRREFIAYGSAAALAATLVKTMVDQEAEAQTAYNLELDLVEIYEEMIDGARRGTLAQLADWTAEADKVLVF